MSIAILNPRFRLRLRPLCGLSVLLLAATIIGCEASAPVQEMSDARQAIAVAIDAGAADLAADELKAAESYLKRAEQKLGEHAYNQARIDANDAKDRAMEALEVVERKSAGK